LDQTSIPFFVKQVFRTVIHIQRDLIPKDPGMELITNLELELEMSFILWCQGDDPSGHLLPREQTELNRQLLAQAHELLKPAILYGLFPIREIREQAVVLDGGATFRGRLLADRFGLAREVALVLCTIGDEVEAQVSAYRQREDEVRAALLDGIGIAAIGELADKAHQLIQEVAAEKGWKASAPFQPGQIDWPLEDHKIFFELLPAEKLGLELNSSHLMAPGKSVSLAVGLGEEMLPLAMERACNYCPLRDECRFSRK
jgi:cobalamin-dependent methionine synthase I